MRNTLTAALRAIRNKIRGDNTSTHKRNTLPTEWSKNCVRRRGSEGNARGHTRIGKAMGISDGAEKGSRKIKVERRLSTSERKLFPHSA